MTRNKLLPVLLAALWLLQPGAASGGEPLALRSPYGETIEKAIGAATPAAPAAWDGAKSVPFGGIVPHHDIALEMIIRFYGELAAHVGARRIFLLSPDHFRRVQSWIAVCHFDWELSSGVLRADKDAVSALQAARVAKPREDLANIFANEHGITLHIPLIARFFPDAAVVPIIVRPDIPDIALLSFRRRLLDMMRDGDIVILSMDMSHYKPPEGLLSEDLKTIPLLTDMRTGGIGAADVDARRAASLFLSLAKGRGSKRGILLERTDSSSILGSRIESGTSYATLVYYMADEQ